ncbi:hypothetical protein BD310DRAFT_933523 [Dichomitus squalens]|uniref:F-box domain-containing protein n=1 Tax=Dichomitus squalens TaxID=114155 RepID=A0A4Q9PMN5_9APHY|nr:hypothetical protein BD310DRAFT_933523 [Dichomitus squalens]
MRESVRGFADPLVDALRSLENLQAFAWFGYYDELRGDIGQALLSSCPQLQHLCVPYCIQLIPLLPKFNALQTLELARERAPPSVYDPAFNHEAVHVTTAIVRYSSTLRTVSLFGDGIWDCSDASFSYLRDVELLSLKDCSCLGAFLTGCARLDSLALSNAGKDSAISFFSALAAVSPDAPPRLTSLKLIFFPTLDQQNGTVLANFLSTKKHLRRLDLVSEQTRWRNSERPLAAVLARLPDLEVLGLELGVGTLSPGHLEFLDQHLPASLTTFVYGTSYWMDTIDENDWLALVCHRDLRCRNVPTTTDPLNSTH